MWQARRHVLLLINSISGCDLVFVFVKGTAALMEFVEAPADSMSAE